MDIRSAVLSLEQEAALTACCRHTLLLDDCLYPLQPSIPLLTRASLHRLPQRHGISRLADVRDRPARMIACQFLRDLIDTSPYRLDTILTDNGVQFRHPPHYRDGPTASFAGHLSDHICAKHGIEEPKWVIKDPTNHTPWLNS